MKKSILAIFSIFSFAATIGAQTAAAQSNQQTDSTPPAQGWVQLTSGTTAGLNCISLVGRDTVYVSGNVLLRSTDSGTTWQQLTTAPATGKLLFVDDTTGYLAATDTAYKTTDGGMSWVAEYDEAGSQGISFPVHDTGWILDATDGYVSRTTNAGKSWDPQRQPPPLINCFAIADTKHGFMMGDLTGPTDHQYASFARMTDGYHWYSAYAGPTTDQQGKNHTGVPTDVLGVVAITPDTVVAVGLSITMSTDGGNDWDTIPYQGDGFNGFFGITFPDHMHGTCVGSSGWVFHSSDAGMTWQRQPSGVLGNLNAAAFVDSALGYACGGDGVIIKTTNGGLSWVNISPDLQNIQGLIYPQPANGEATISYTLQESQNVSLFIQNVTGSNVETILSRVFQSSGSQSVTINTSAFASGTYTYVLQSEKYYATGEIEVVH